VAARQRQAAANRERRRCRWSRTTLNFFLQALHLLLELLIAVLQLLDRPGKITDRPFQAVNARHEFGGVHHAILRAGRRSPKQAHERSNKRDHGERGGADHFHRHLR
jgi:hypothetical protein